MNYLCTMIGEGELRRSDVAFSLPRELRQAIEEVAAGLKLPTAGRISRELEKRGISCSRFDVKIYLDYRRARVVLGDMYEVVRNIEVRLHSFIKRVFIAEYGEENWWRSGVPEKIRAECAALREKDPEPAPDPYCYTHLIALREILDRGWPVLSGHLPKKVTANKKDFLDRLLQLNRIRNSVMHPVRGDLLSEEEFDFAYSLESDLGLLNAPIEPAQLQEKESPTPTSADHQPTTATPNELVSRLSPANESQPEDLSHQSEEEKLVPSVKAS